MPTRIYVPSIGASLTLPDGMSPEAMTAAVNQLKRQHVASGMPRPPSGPSNAELRAQMAQERATQDAEAPGLAMRIATSDPVMGILGIPGAAADLFGRAVAGAGNAVVATGKMALGQPLEDIRAVQVPILDAQGRDTGRTEFRNEWYPTYKWYGQGQPTALAPQNDPATQAKIGRDVEAPLPKPDETTAETVVRKAREAQRGVNQGLSDFGQGLTTPENLPFVVQGGVNAAHRMLNVPLAPPSAAVLGAEKPLQTTFIPGMVEGAVAANERVWDPNATLEQQVQAGLEALLSGGMAAHAFAGLAAKPTVPAGDVRLTPVRKMIDGEMQTVYEPTATAAPSGLRPGDIEARLRLTDKTREQLDTVPPDQRWAAMRENALKMDETFPREQVVRPRQEIPIIGGEMPTPRSRIKSVEILPSTEVTPGRAAIPSERLADASGRFNLVDVEARPTRQPLDTTPRLYLNPIGPLLRDVGRAIKTGYDRVGRPLYRMSDKVIAYDTKPIIDRLRSKGGEATRSLASSFHKISSDAHTIYGELGQHFDKAQRLAGRPTAANRWADRRVEVTPDAAFTQGRATLERRLKAPPAFAAHMAEIAKANFEGGKMLETVTPGFKAGDKPQSMLTGDGIELLRNDAKAREAWIQGAIKINPHLDPQIIRTKFEGLSHELSKPGFDTARIAQIAQDIRQTIPHAITHVRVNGRWVEVIESNLSRYLHNLRSEVAEVTAFRREFPRDSDKFTKARDAATKELAQAGQGDSIEDIHTLTRALQGQPINPHKGPGVRAAERVMTAARHVINPLKAAKLTTSSIVNSIEAWRGGASGLVGHKTFKKAAREFLKDPRNQAAILHAKGYADAVFRDWNFYPNRPFESASRITSQAIHKYSGTIFFNELVEHLNAATGKLIRDQIVRGDWAGLDRTRIGEVMRLMDFTDVEIAKALGGDVPLLDRFATRFAGLATGGNLGRAERSYGAHNTLLNGASWFRSYTQNVVNRLRGSLGNFIDASIRYQQTRSPADAGRAYANAKIFSATLFNTSLQGFFASGIMAGLTGLGYGLASWAEEARNHYFEVAKSVMASGIGGPLAQVARGEAPGKRVKIAEKAASFVPMFGELQELSDLANMDGRYNGMNVPTAVGTYLEGRFAISKVIRTGLAVAGLAAKNVELDAADLAFKRWKRRKLGFFEGDGGKPDTAAFRHQMKVVLSTLNKGGDWVAEISKIPGIKGDTANKTRAEIGEWLGGRTILKNKTGSPLTPDETKDLISYIGQKAYDTLRAHDAMVRELQSTLTARDKVTGSLNPIESVKPTGKAAVYQEAQPERDARVLSALTPDVSKTLSRLKYTPTWTPPATMSPAQAKVAEKEFVTQLNSLLSVVDDSWPESVQRKTVSRLTETARKIAEATGP